MRVNGKVNGIKLKAMQPTLSLRTGAHDCELGPAWGTSESGASGKSHSSVSLAGGPASRSASLNRGRGASGDTSLRLETGPAASESDVSPPDMLERILGGETSSRRLAREASNERWLRTDARVLACLSTASALPSTPSVCIHGGGEEENGCPSWAGVAATGLENKCRRAACLDDPGR